MQIGRCSFIVLSKKMSSGINYTDLELSLPLTAHMHIYITSTPRLALTLAPKAEVLRIKSEHCQGYAGIRRSLVNLYKAASL